MRRVAQLAAKPLTLTLFPEYRGEGTRRSRRKSKTDRHFLFPILPAILFPLMPAPNKILLKMQDRLLAALVNGPSLNCRPYASRQRLDLVQLGKLGDIPPEEVLRDLLGTERRTTIKARVPQ